MPTVPPRRFSTAESHNARLIAESFGTDPERYDRSRPRYPDSLVQAILENCPDRDVLDVGIGTGVVARSLRRSGARVLGVDADERMAEFARRDGFEVEVARFEQWDPAGRSFDAVVAGQTWHWVDPAAGADRAAAVLRAEGRLAVFWNVFEPPADLGMAFTDVYRRVLPDSLFSRGTTSGVAAYSGQFIRAADGIRGSGAFAEPEEWRFDWEHSYTREEWLDLVPTTGGHNLFPPEKLEELLAGLGAAIDAVGGNFTMRYATVAVTTTRHP